MNDQFTPLLQFFVAIGEVVGRKKCQKLIHILQECGHDFGFDFKLALYGAFSSDLQGQLENFVESRYIREVPSTTDIAGYRTSKFVTSSHSPKILKILGLDEEPGWKKLANDLNQRTSRELEATSTIMFLRRSGTQDAQLPEKFATLKPHLINIYESGLELANELRSRSN
jgi:uncharacterized protein YwgA